MGIFYWLMADGWQDNYSLYLSLYSILNAFVSLGFKHAELTNKKLIVQSTNALYQFLLRTIFMIFLPNSIFQNAIFNARILFVSVFILCIQASFISQAAPTKPNTNELLLPFNEDWQYLKENHTNAADALSSSAWVGIHIPHTWNATDTMDSAPGYRRSASWYKKNLKSPKNNDQWVTKIYFEGANYETQVYVNKQLVGEHVGGYVGFEFNISDYLQDKGNNEILVRVSNRYNPNLIPSQKSDFFLYGGITRDVWIKHLPNDHIEYLAISTPKVSKSAATTNIKASIQSKQGNEQYSMVATLISPLGEQVLQSMQSATLMKGLNTVEIALPILNEPALWSPNTPNLYKVRVDLVSNNQVTHTLTESIGYRWFEMKAHKGFFLNGERLLIRGTHRHEEHAGVGAAVSNEQHRIDMQMIKDMGANFVRLGHYPQDPEIYKAANELGLLIWDELPWCRGGKGGDEWEKNTEHLLTAMIKQNYNHPSIIFWSLGNEMYWEEDFPGGGATDIINPYLQKLQNITKEMDPQRLTSIRKYYPGAEMVDSFSPSIWAGWYGGAYNQYQEALEKAHAKYPAFLHMEYGGSSHVGRHTETPITAAGLVDAQVSVEEAVNQAIVKSVAKDTDWSESYIVDLFDWHLNVSENFAGFAGNAQWAFKDFGTPLRPENPLPYMNQKGLVDREGNFKDAYWVFASYWKKEPFCNIESETWTHRNGPKEGREVTVYCNTQSAELFHDGTSLGKKDKQKGVVPAGGLVWQVPFTNGQNKLSVIGYNDNKKVAKDTHQVTYLIGKHGKYKHIALTARKIADNRWLIGAEAQDDQGNRVLDYQERVQFFNIGDQGHLLENYGTPSKSSIIEMGSGYAEIQFESNGKPSTIEFRTQNIKGVYIEVNP
jgi:beta-galactosidase